MGYFGDLFNSFKPGGQTPLQALLGVPEDVNGVMEYFNYIYSQPTWYDAMTDPDFVPAGERQAQEELQQALTATSSDVVTESEEPYVESITDSILDAAYNQNISSQSSADRAMEFEAEQAELNRQFQASQAQKFMEWEVDLSNTAYQRAMSDLKAAGLNPKLVGQFGAASVPSATVPSGAQASGMVANMSMANTSALAGVLESYITSAASLTNKDKDFVQSIISSIISAYGMSKMKVK